MRIADSWMDGGHAAQRSLRLRIFLLMALTVLLQGCATNVASCDGRFEPINLPAPVSMKAQEEGGFSRSDNDHE